MMTSRKKAIDAIREVHSDTSKPLADTLEDLEEILLVVEELVDVVRFEVEAEK